MEVVLHGRTHKPLAPHVAAGGSLCRVNMDSRQGSNKSGAAGPVSYEAGVGRKPMVTPLCLLPSSISLSLRHWDTSCVLLSCEKERHIKTFIYSKYGRIYP